METNDGRAPRRHCNTYCTLPLRAGRYEYFTFGSRVVTSWQTVEDC